MIAAQPIANPNRTPTHQFITEWRSAGAQQGLPRWMVIADEDGTPTAKFMSLARAAFSLSPAISLNARTPIINLGDETTAFGTPTEAMIIAWQTWTS